MLLIYKQQLNDRGDMKNKTQKNIPRPHKKAAIFANWYRVGVVGLFALPSVFQLITGIIRRDWF